ncbi:Glycopeptide antibiotics resistance protein [Bacillus sp. UNCCL81]|nr:Glycopeptide antibiotics resistance protein [Bacillus sp. UNCCL81]
MLNFLYPSIIISTFFILYFGYQFLKGSITLLKLLYWMIFGIYFTSLINFTFFPFPYQKLLIQIMIEDRLGHTHNFIPFKSIIDTFSSGSILLILKQVAGNVLLFIPLGFALPILFFNISNRNTIVIGFTLSLAIELIQASIGMFLGYNYRSCDIDDILLNTIGTIIGLAIYKTSSTYFKNFEEIIDKNLTS